MHQHGPGQAGAGNVCRGPGTGKAFPLSLSAHGKPRAGVGCVPGGPRWPMEVALRPFPCLRPPQAPLSSFTPFPLPCFTQARAPPAAQPAPWPAWLPARGCVTPGTAGLEGRSRWRERSPARKRNFPTLGGPRLSLSASPLPHTSHVPQISWVSSPSYLCSQCFWGIPLFPPTPPSTLTFGTRMPCGSLGTAAGAPKPSVSPQGLLVVPLPRSPPLPVPRAHPWPGCG